MEISRNMMQDFDILYFLLIYFINKLANFNLKLSS